MQISEHNLCIFMFLKLSKKSWVNP